jgi:hypothetical protein
MPLDRLQTYGRLSKTEHPRKSPADDPRACRFKGVRRTHHRGCTEPFQSSDHPRVRGAKGNCGQNDAYDKHDEYRLAQKSSARLDRRFYNLMAVFVHDRLLCVGKHAQGCKVPNLPGRWALVQARAGCQPATMGKMDAVILPASGCDTNASVRVGI